MATRGLPTGTTRTTGREAVGVPGTTGSVPQPVEPVAQQDAEGFAGLLLDQAGPTTLPWPALTLLTAALATTLTGRRDGFPALGGTRSREIDAPSS